MRKPFVFVLSALLAIQSATTLRAEQPFNYVARILGFGWSDGYHARERECRSCDGAFHLPAATAAPSNVFPVDSQPVKSQNDVGARIGPVRQRSPFGFTATRTVSQPAAAAPQLIVAPPQPATQHQTVVNSPVPDRMAAPASIDEVPSSIPKSVPRIRRPWAPEPRPWQ